MDKYERKKGIRLKRLGQKRNYTGSISYYDSNFNYTGNSNDKRCIW